MVRGPTEQEWIDALIQANKGFEAMDMVAAVDHGLDHGVAIAFVKHTVDGIEVQHITMEEFNGWPVETITVDELRQRYPAGPIELLDVPDIGPITYKMKEVRDELDRIFIPPQKHTHPTSPRKSK